MTAQDGSNTGQQEDVERRALFRRDAIIRTLWTALDQNRAEARAAARRLDARIAEALKLEVAKKQQQQRVTLALLPIAKEWAVDPERLNKPSAMTLDWDKPPKHFDPLAVLSPGQPVPEWASRAFNAVGRFDREIASELENLTGHIQNAATGKMGDVQIEDGIDIRKISGLEAYVHAISRLWSRGRYSKRQVKEDLTGKVRVPKGMKAHSLLVEEVMRFSDMSRELPTGADTWWDIAFLVRVLVDSEFDPRSVGSRLLPEWHTNGLFDDRSGVFAFRAETERVPQSQFWLTAERAARWLRLSGSRATARKSDRRTPPTRTARKPDDDPENRGAAPPDAPLPGDRPNFNDAKPDRGLDSTRPYIDEDRGCLVFGNNRCQLGKRSSPVFRLMRELCANPDHLFETSDLGALVWPSGYRNGSNRVPVVVAKCRVAFREAGMPESIILSQPRGTYRLGPEPR